MKPESQLIKVCAWCPKGETKQEQEQDKITHGICDDCLDKQLKELR